MSLSLGHSASETFKEMPQSFWSESTMGTMRKYLLESLRYEEMYNRQETIARALDGTFEWVFEDPLSADEGDFRWSNFREWLKNGSDIYWITGKPGSGKSTLMKFIYQDERTRRLLLDWRPGNSLITASFYFDNSRTLLENSQEALLCSLLHQLIKAKSGGTDKSLLTILDTLIFSGDLSEPEMIDKLLQALTLLLEDRVISYTFFLDGLNEYEGDKRDLACLVHQINSHQNVKVCVSSRPWTEFELAFRKMPRLVLQHLTYQDIGQYVQQKFSNHQGFSVLSQYGKSSDRFWDRSSSFQFQGRE